MSTYVTTPPGVREWNAAVATGLIRVGAGVLLLRRPGRLITLSGGAPDDRVLRTVFAYFGVRDIALGVSALAATRPGSDVPRQLRLQGLADTVDTALVAGLVATGRLGRERGTGAAVLAAATAVAEFATSLLLGRR